MESNTTDFEALFGKLHTMKTKERTKLTTWIKLRVLFLLLPLMVLAMVVALASDIGNTANLVFATFAALLWVPFLALCWYVAGILGDQAVIARLFAISKGDEDVPDMDWELDRLRDRSKQGKTLFWVSLTTFLLYLVCVILSYMLPDHLDDFESGPELLPELASIGGFLILVVIGLQIFKLDLYINMDEVAGKFAPDDVAFHSPNGILDFVECFLPPSSRADLRAFRDCLDKAAGTESTLFFAQLSALVYLHLDERLLENWGDPKFFLTHEMLIQHVVELFPKETFLENLPLFKNMLQRRMRIELISRIKSIERLGSVKDDQLAELLVPLLQLQENGAFIQAFRQALESPAFDRAIAAMLQLIGQDHLPLQCVLTSNSMIKLDEKAALHLLVVNNSEQDQLLSVRVTSPLMYPERFEWAFRSKMGNHLDKLPNADTPQLFFTTKTGNDLRTAAGVYLANSQGFCLQLHPQAVGKSAIKVTVVNKDTQELISSYQTTVRIRRNVREQLKRAVGMVSVIAGPAIGAARFLLGGII